MDLSYHILGLAQNAVPEVFLTAAFDLICKSYPSPVRCLKDQLLTATEESLSTPASMLAWSAAFVN